MADREDRVTPISKKKRGPRWREGENVWTGSSLKREQQEEYIEWLVTPESERKPRFKKDMAAHLGVDPRTLNYWEKEPRVAKEVHRRAKNGIRVAKVPAILESLFVTAMDTASARQVAAAKVLLDYSEKAIEDVSAEDLAERSPEELAKMLAEAHDLILESSGN